MAYTGVVTQTDRGSVFTFNQPLRDGRNNQETQALCILWEGRTGGQQYLGLRPAFSWNFTMEKATDRPSLVKQRAAPSPAQPQEAPIPTCCFGKREEPFPPLPLNALIDVRPFNPFLAGREPCQPS